MSRSLRFIFASASLLATALAETPSNPIALYNGKDLSGWEFVTPGKEPITSVCHIKPDGVLAVDGKPNGYLQVAGTYENYRLHGEWRWPDKPGNGGFLVHISNGPVDRIWPTSIQIQTKNTRVGDLLPMAAAKFAEPLSTAPGAATAILERRGADTEKPVGEWNTCDIICRGDTIEVSVNGVVQNKITKCVPASGKIGLQLEGIPYELRNFRLEPLK